MTEDSVIEVEVGIRLVILLTLLTFSRGSYCEYVIALEKGQLVLWKDVWALEKEVNIFESWISYYTLPYLRYQCRARTSMKGNFAWWWLAFPRF